MNLIKYIPALKDYTELRIQKNQTEVIVFQNGNCITNKTSTNSGAFARTFTKKAWGCV
jgi:predicted Zn-dependent protease